MSGFSWQLSLKLLAATVFGYVGAKTRAFGGVISGVICFVIFALLTTKVESDVAGPAYVAYGGIYVV